MKSKSLFPFGIFLLFALSLWGAPNVEGASDPIDYIACSSHDDCRSINGSICGDKNNCTCPQLTPIFVNVTKLNESFCMTALNLTKGNCTFHQQCDYENGKCLKDSTCGCQPKFVVDGNQCVPYAKSSIIPIAVGVALGMCVIAVLIFYLWLSRRKE